MSALERHHDSFDGTIVQRLGDGSMSYVPELARGSDGRGRDPAGARRRQNVQVRIGIHVGEVIVEPERLTGDAVNVAARIELFAVPGGVMLSDAAYDQIKNRNDLAVVPLGRFRLKNVGRPSSCTRSRPTESSCRTPPPSRARVTLASLPEQPAGARHAPRRPRPATWALPASSAGAASSRSWGPAGSARPAPCVELARCSPRSFSTASRSSNSLTSPKPADFVPAARGCPRCEGIR